MIFWELELIKMRAKPPWYAQQSVCWAIWGRRAYQQQKRRRAQCGQSTETGTRCGQVIKADRLWLLLYLTRLVLQLPSLPIIGWLQQYGLLFISEATQTAACWCVKSSTQNYQPLALGPSLECWQLVLVSWQSNWARNRPHQSEPSQWWLWEVHLADAPFCEWALNYILLL